MRQKQLADYLARSQNKKAERFTDTQRLDFLEQRAGVFGGRDHSGNFTGDRAFGVLPAPTVRESIDNAILAQPDALKTVLLPVDPHMATRIGPIDTGTDLTASFKSPTWEPIEPVPVHLHKKK